MQYWFKNFREGNYDINDCRGGDQTYQYVLQERIVSIKESFEKTRSWTIRSLSAQLGIPMSNLHDIIIKNLRMTKINTK